MTEKKLFLNILTMACGTVLLNNSVCTAEILDIIPGVSIKQEYNDNIFFVPNNESDDFISTFSPNLKLRKKTERFDGKAQSQVNFVEYVDNDELDGVDHSHQAQLEYQLTPILSFAGDANFQKDSRADRELETTGLVLSPFTRKHQDYSVSGRYLWSERIGSSLQLFYGTDHYKDPSLVDADRSGAQIQFNYDLSHVVLRTIGRASLRYTKFDFPQSTINNYTCLFGADREMDEKRTLGIDLGPRYSHSTLPAGKNDDWGIVGSIFLHHKGELSDVEVSISREEGVVSGRAGTAERTSINFDAKNHFSEDLLIGLQVKYRKNKSEPSFTGILTNEDVYIISSRLKYAMNEDFSGVIAYDYSIYTDKTISGDGSQRQRNKFLVRLDYAYPLFDR